MKNLTFTISCFLLFRLEQGTRRDELMECFEKMIAGKWSVPPVNLPFTPYNRSVKESKKVQHMIKEFISEKAQNSSKKKLLLYKPLSLAGLKSEMMTMKKF